MAAGLHGDGEQAGETVLEVKDLHVSTNGLEAVRGVDLAIPAGGRLGVVGESGAGKSLTALAVMGLLPDGWSASGVIEHDGANLLDLDERSLARRRGRTLSMVFQDPLSSLNPTKRVGHQITSVLRRHTDVRGPAASKAAAALLGDLGLPRPESILRSYPHQLSGGQRQRVMIASALACYPRLIIADEPTTALDATVQKQVLKILDAAVLDRGCALLLITHDLAVISAMCDRVAVMYCGRIVETGDVTEVFTRPRHPYTAALLRAQPTMDNIDLDERHRLPAIPGSVPSLADIPTGCAFRPRCSHATESCLEAPVVSAVAHPVECWHPVTVGAGDRTP